ncbi:MAG: hypothetical protein KKD44_07220 [Proteobacteria bacterium]|nr:hypothetical protein [Pseudomonadota bacterium]
MIKISSRVLWLLCIALTLCFTGCGGDSDSTPPTPAASGSITGTVIDFSNGNAVSNARIIVGSKEASSNTSGEFSITGITFDDHITVNIEADGYLEGSQITLLSLDSLDAQVLVKLIPITYTGTFDPAVAQTLTVPGSPAAVILDAGAINGTGTVTVDITVIDPTSDPGIMPGDFSAINTLGGDDIIESFGAIGVTFTDEDGLELNLTSGSTATIRIPVAKQPGVTAPTTIPLYYYDTDLGKWIEEGTATLSLDETYYEGTVTHFTTWNADLPLETVTITGCVIDLAQNPVAYATIELRGKDYTGSSWATSDSAGNFSIKAKLNAVSIIYATSSGVPTNTMEINTAESTELPSCLLLADITMQIKLTWGENPSDLDSHMLLPDDTHIYYSEKGDVTQSPFIGLDVDDTDSYGPEVITIMKFENPGTYSYWVHHFSGSGDISASPARVQLTMDGTTRIFTPPAGTPQGNWNVFNIIVDESGNTEIVTVNTWGTVIDPSKKAVK